ncbi:MAG: YlbF family regulator [Ruminococcus sp.]|jgi:hypothetical protein|nr:YlbF family regulator [Ruminococcus sp.]
MDIIQMTRELGKALQADSRYTYFTDVRAKMDADEDLQIKIRNFNLERMNLNNELSKDEKN